MEQPKVGQHVVYVDERGVARDALVTANWGSSINVVVVETDENQTDSYGRKIARETSQVHRSNQQAPGRYWRWPNETA
jgi:hypothetical protein